VFSPKRWDVPADILADFRSEYKEDRLNTLNLLKNHGHNRNKERAKKQKNNS